MAATFKKHLIIGLTGVPGSGKSLVAEILEEKGAQVIDADRLGHEILKKDPAVRRKLLKLLGLEIATIEGELDRNRIGAIVFYDHEKLKAFNQIVHPELLRRLRRRMAEKKNSKRARIIVVDAALIFEWGIADWFDIILVVTARRDLRLKRLSRGGLSHNQARKRLAAQFPQHLKAGLADYIIENNTTRKSLRQKVERFAEDIGELV